MAKEGIAGALLLAIGGMILSAFYYQLMSFVYSHVLEGSGFSLILFIIFGFLGFFILGLGLLLIIEGGVRRAKQTSS